MLLYPLLLASLVCSMNASSRSHRQIRQSNDYWYDPYTTIATTTTTTTRRPKATQTPEVKTLTSKERELHEAAARGWDVSIAALCAEGINPNVADANNRGYTPLHLTVPGRHLPAAMTLIRCGANLNGVDSDGNTTLHLAVGREDHWMTALLLLAKPNPFVVNKRGMTPYQLALVAKDPNFGTMFGNTTLLSWFIGWRQLNDWDRAVRNYIANGYYMELVKMCVDGRLNPNVGDANDNRNTAMHAAAVAQVNQPMVLQALVRCGGDVNVANLQGVTPLQMAVSGSNSAATSALLLHGADPFIRNNQGQTAYQLGQQSTNSYIRTLFSPARVSWYLDNLYP